MHRLGYNVFDYPKLCLPEIHELIDGYLEENKTDKQRKEEETEAIIEKLRQDALRDNIELKGDKKR